MEYRLILVGNKTGVYGAITEYYEHPSLFPDVENEVIYNFKVIYINEEYY